MNKISFLFILFILGCPFFLGAQSSFPSLKKDPLAVEYAQRAKSGMSWEDLAEISLWASGVENPAAQGSGGRLAFLLKNAVSNLLAEQDLPPGERDRGEYIQEFMFKKQLLKRYSENQTRMDTLLDNGNYNCVSSAVLYAIFAKALGLDVRGVVTKDHVFIKLIAEGREIDIETTNRYGFEPGNRKEFHDGFGSATGFAYVPAHNYQSRTDINSLELISLIFNNRITELERASRFAEAVPLAISRAELLSNPTDTKYSNFFADPQKMVMDRIFNYGAYLIKQGKENDALLWADIASPLYPDPVRWKEFVNAGLNNLLLKLVRAKRFTDAWNALAANAPRLDAEDHKRLGAMLADADLSQKVSAIKTAKDADDVLGLLKNSPALLPAGRLREMTIYTLCKKAEFTAQSGGYKTAIAFIETALKEHGPDSRFDNLLKAFRANRVAELHNAFAEAYNKKNFENARALLEDALGEFPGNSQLLRDKEIADKAR
ncbi:MAG: hypothetical protein LBF78_12790 [Treponema sp.]|jgi:tetratricopeptide (TPR) repeat protein|nr:hypothetical protein [Treponema sp.]